MVGFIENRPFPCGSGVRIGNVYADRAGFHQCIRHRVDERRIDGEVGGKERHELGEGNGGSAARLTRFRREAYRTHARESLLRGELLKLLL